MRLRVCSAGQPATLLVLYVFMLGLHATSHDGLELIELEPEIITSELNAIVFFDIYIPENNLNLSLIRPNGETVHFNKYYDDSLRREDIDDVRLYTHETLNDINSTEDVLKDELGRYDDIEIIDKCYYHHRQLDNSDKCKIYGETICDGGFDSRKIKVGPLRQEHHGNWVLSVYFYENEKKIVEAFRVISLEIIENINVVPEKSILKTGNTFKLSLGLIIPYLESCELISPKTTQDRYYERDVNNLDKCGYVIHNVTLEDQGFWKIIAVGKIVYEGSGYLYITDNITQYL